MRGDAEEGFDHEIPVLIVGGGPIGLSLAADLGWRGVPSMLVERNDETIGPAKMLLVSIRTMEFCRRLGIADKVAHWGFPEDFPLDNVFVTSLNGYEIGRIPLPAMGVPQPRNYSPEIQRHCPQTWFDPIMRDFARGFNTNWLRYRCRVETFTQDADGATVSIVDEESGKLERIRARYVVGCDGYSSTIRNSLGIAMRGRPVLDHSINIEIRVPEQSRFHDKGDAGRYIMVGPEGTWATYVAIDGRSTWRLTLYGANDIDVDAIDIDAAIRRVLGRDDIPYEINHVGKWVRRMLVSDWMRDGNIFIAGDAAHTYPPNGGFGMNTGIQDAMDLGWKLSAVLQGWGGPTLLDSYDIERRPVAWRNGTEALTNYERLTSKTQFPGILEKNETGAERRRELGQRLIEQNTKAWRPIGLHLGYVYYPSPVVCRDQVEPIQDDTNGYQPSTIPGARAPHAWLPDGRSMLDLFGKGFTLLRFGAYETNQTSLLAAAAKRRAMPIQTHNINDPRIADLYGHRFVLVRPDGHVAWRGNSEPEDALDVIDRVRGASSQHVPHSAN